MKTTISRFSPVIGNKKGDERTASGRGLNTAPGLVSPALRWYRKSAVNNLVLGLTVRGTPRRRRPNADLRAAEIQERRERSLAAWNRRVNRLRDQGLTSRGTPRIYAVRRGDALLMRHQVDALAEAIQASFPDLPAAAQARALALANHLSAVRRQLL